MTDPGKLPKKLDLEQATRLAQSETGQALLATLQAQNNQALQSAVAQAQAGDFDQVKKTLEGFLSSPEGRTFLERLRGQGHG